MCRMLGYVTRTPVTLADLLGEQDLQDFAELSRKHGDGWGFARAVGDVMEVTKAADAARTSSLFSASRTKCWQIWQSCTYAGRLWDCPIARLQRTPLQPITSLRPR